MYCIQSSARKQMLLVVMLADLRFEGCHFNQPEGCYLGAINVTSIDALELAKQRRESIIQFLAFVIY